MTVQALEASIAAAHRIIFVTATADDPVLIVNSQFCAAASSASSAEGDIVCKLSLLDHSRRSAA